jgi:hypothetical protein
MRLSAKTKSIYMFFLRLGQWKKWYVCVGGNGFLQLNTCDALMLFGTDLCNLGSMTGLGNFGGI